MLRLAFDFIITWRETRTRPNAYGQPIGRPRSFTCKEPCKGTENKGFRSINKYVCRQE